jgi:hypothetical protein
MQLFNQFSYVIFGLIFAVGLWMGLRRVPKLNRVMRLLLVAVYALGVVWVGSQFRYPDSPVAVASVADVEAVLNDDTPTFVMLYSNY